MKSKKNLSFCLESIEIAQNESSINRKKEKIFPPKVQYNFSSFNEKMKSKQTLENVRENGTEKWITN